MSAPRSTREPATLFVIGAEILNLAVQLYSAGSNSRLSDNEPTIRATSRALYDVWQSKGIVNLPQVAKRTRWGSSRADKKIAYIFCSPHRSRFATPACPAVYTTDAKIQVNSRAAGPEGNPTSGRWAARRQAINGSRNRRDARGFREKSATLATQCGQIATSRKKNEPDKKCPARAQIRKLLKQSNRGNQSRKPTSSWLRLGCCSLRTALASIWRIRSRVTLKM
jgi:hypothetical protein